MSKAVMLDSLAILIVSLAVLARAAQEIIDASLKIAAYFKLPEKAVGFLLLSVATSLPELAVSITSALAKKSALSIGNVLGANISDVGLVLGTTALLGTVAVKKRETREIVILLVGAAALPVLLRLGLFGNYAGAILITAFLAFCTYALQHTALEEKQPPVRRGEAAQAAVVLALAVAALALSSQYVISSASGLALAGGISQTLVAATLVSWGTTLPELAVNVAAIRKKKAMLAVGNIVGSIVTNLTLVWGASALINPAGFALSTSWFLMAAAAALYALLAFLLSRNHKLAKREGIILMAAYGTFLVLAAVRETGFFEVIF